MAGGCLGMGIVSARTQTEHDPAYALLYEYVEKVRVRQSLLVLSDAPRHPAAQGCTEGVCAGEYVGNE